MTPDNCKSLFDTYSKTVQKQSSDAAFEFTAKLVTLRITNAVLNKYKGSIRATVHPKHGQFGIHLVNSHSRVFPWQGVVIKNNFNKFYTTSTQQVWKEAKYEVFDKDSGDFLYYADKNTKIGDDLL